MSQADARTKKGRKHLCKLNLWWEYTTGKVLIPWPVFKNVVTLHTFKMHKEMPFKIPFPLGDEFLSISMQFKPSMYTAKYWPMFQGLNYLSEFSTFFLLK